LDEQLRLLGFHMQQGAENQEEEEAPADYYTVPYRGALELISGQMYFFIIFWRCHFLAALVLIST
jgi:hypothetical protein